MGARADPLVTVGDTFCRLCCQLSYWLGVPPLCAFATPPFPEHLSDDEMWRCDRTQLRPIARGDTINLVNIAEAGWCRDRR